MKRAPEIYWLVQTQADVPTTDEWLTTAELASLRRTQVPKRLSDWRLGRWTAKCAVAAFLGWTLDRIGEIEIRPAASGAPEVVIDSQPAPRISISHRAEFGMCAIGPSTSAPGCDLELVEPRTDAFITDYFTAGECALVQQTHAGHRPMLANLLWSAKESALKSLAEGLRVDARWLQVDLFWDEGEFTESGGVLEEDEWNWLLVSYGTRQFPGWWQLHGNCIRTVIGSSLKPVRLSRRPFHLEQNAR